MVYNVELVRPCTDEQGPPSLLPPFPPSPPPHLFSSIHLSIHPFFPPSLVPSRSPSLPPSGPESDPNNPNNKHIKGKEAYLEGVREIERAWREIDISLREEDDDPHRFDKEEEEDQEGGREGEGEGVPTLSMKRIAERYVASLREGGKEGGREEATEGEIASTIEAQYHYLLHPPPSAAHATLTAPVAAAGVCVSSSSSSSPHREGTGNHGEKAKEKKKYSPSLKGPNHRQSSYICHINANTKRKQAAALEKIEGFVQEHGLREKVLMDLDVENRPKVKRKELTGVSPGLFPLTRGWGMVPVM